MAITSTVGELKTDPKPAWASRVLRGIVLLRGQGPGAQHGLEQIDAYRSFLNRSVWRMPAKGKLRIAERSFSRKR